MNISDCKLKEVINVEIYNFDCTNDSFPSTHLNDFLINDAKNYHKHSITNTHLFVDKSDNIICYFSLSNSELKLKSNFLIKSKYDELSERLFPDGFSRDIIPAIKITKLAVDKKYQGTEVAKDLMLFIKAYTKKHNLSACRFILVDSNNNDRTKNYYLKNGFEFIRDGDKSNKTRMMYYDLNKFNL